MTSPRLFLTIDELSEANYPAIVTRRDDIVLVTWDPRALRVDITAHLIEILTKPEQDRLVAGLGMSWPLPEWTTARDHALLYVPPALRLHGAGALQGGPELARRASICCGLMLEYAALDAEARGETVDFQEVDDTRLLLMNTAA